MAQHPSICRNSPSDPRIPLFRACVKLLESRLLAHIGLFGVIAVARQIPESCGTPEQWARTSTSDSDHAAIAALSPGACFGWSPTRGEEQ